MRFSGKVSANAVSLFAGRFLIILKFSEFRSTNSIEKSEAGNYQSFLDIDANLGSKIVNAVDKVIESYKKKGRLDIKNQILIQKNNH